MCQISIRRKATNIEIPAALPAVSTKIGGNVRFRLISVNRRTGPTADNQHVCDCEQRHEGNGVADHADDVGELDCLAGLVNGRPHDGRRDS
jgi:hypothetical protein